MNRGGREERAPAAVLKYGPQSAFAPDEFAKAIQAQGLDFLWSRAVECPCMGEDTDQHNPACSRCYGDGWWYVNPAVYDETHATRDSLPVRAIWAATGRQGTTLDYEPGPWMNGEATMSFQAHTSVGYRDRFVGIDQRMTRSEVLTRSGDRAAGTVVPVGKSLRTTVAQREALRYEPLFVNFIADDGPTVYYPRVDFDLRESTLTEPTRLVWFAGRGPAVGARYTVHYDFRPVWVVDESPSGFSSRLPGPPAGAKGLRSPQFLPTSFKVLLDYLTPKRGS